MTFSIVLLIIFVLSFLFFIFRAYKQSPQKSFLNFLSIFIPIILSSLALYIGNLLLPDLNISYFIAGIGSVVFYFFLAPIIIRETPNRYRKVTVPSRMISCFIAIISWWLVSSFVMFFIILTYNDLPGYFDTINRILLIPIKILWFIKM